MHIERSHNVGKDEAIHKIDTFLDDLMHRQFPGGVTIKEPFKSWSDDAMHFSFAAKKGFIATTISGIIRVNNDSIVIDSDLPGLVTTFISEDKIRDVINGAVGPLILGLTYFSRSHYGVIRVYDEAGNVIETHEHAGEFKEP